MMKNIKIAFKKTQGSVLAVTLIILGMVLVIALSVALVSVKERKSSMTSSKSDVAYQNAESGMEKAMEVILKDLIDDNENVAGEIPVSTVTSEIGSCDGANEYATGNDWKVQLVSNVDDDNDGKSDMIPCDSPLDIYEVKDIKSVGTDPQSQTRRAINASVVQKDPNIKLLLHADKLNSNEFIDSSRVHHTVSKNGGVSIDINDKEFGAGSARLNGNGDLNISSNKDWDFSDRSFTIDFWAKVDNSGSNVQTLIDLDGSVKESYDLNLEQFAVTLNGSSLCTFNYGSNLANGNWHHVALVRDSENNNEVNLYVDGSDLSSIPDPCVNNGLLSSTKVYVGCDSNKSKCFKGNIDELRIYRDFLNVSPDEGAYWPGGFSVPLDPY